MSSPDPSPRQRACGLLLLVVYAGLLAGVELTSTAAFDEPLPYVPPASGTTELTLSRARGWLQLEARWAAAQRRVASSTTLEDATPAWAVADVRAEWTLTPGLRVQAGVDNLLDRAYHEHLSVGNLPAPGRSLRLALDVER